MRNAFLVAWRDYAESAKTKGFWIGLLLLPIIILLAIQVPQWLEKKGSPQRYFVLVDQSGDFEEVIDDELQKAHQRRALTSLILYAAENASIEKAVALLEKAKADAKAAREKNQNIPQTLTEQVLSGISNMAAKASEDLLDDALDGLEREKENIGLLQSGLRLAVYVDDGSLRRNLNAFLSTNPDLMSKFREEGVKEQWVALIQSIVRDDADEFEESRQKYVKVKLPDGVDAKANFPKLAQELKPYLRGGKKALVDGQPQKLYAAIFIPADVKSSVPIPGASAKEGAAKGDGVEYWASNLADLELHNDVRNWMNREIRNRAFEDMKVDIQQVRRIDNIRVPFSMLNPKKEAGKEKASDTEKIKQWAPVAFVYLLWISIFTVSQMLLTNTIEEKSNRIIEVLLSSVTPGELMMGKLAGIAAIGLTMVGTWILSLVGILAWKVDSGVEQLKPILEILTTSNLLPAFFIYFIFGYLLYAGIILTIGSLCSTLKDAQNYMGAVTVIMMVPMLTMMFIPKDPHGTMATVLSWIPIYTPFTMMNRAAADPPMFDVVGTMILLIATTVLVLWLSGKIFRIGILRTGQPPKLLELFRWVRDSMKGKS